MLGVVLVIIMIAFVLGVATELIFINNNFLVILAIYKQQAYPSALQQHLFSHPFNRSILFFSASQHPPPPLHPAHPPFLDLAAQQPFPHNPMPPDP